MGSSCSAHKYLFHTSDTIAIKADMRTIFMMGFSSRQERFSLKHLAKGFFVKKIREFCCVEWNVIWSSEWVKKEVAKQAQAGGFPSSNFVWLLCFLFISFSAWIKHKNPLNSRSLAWQLSEMSMHTHINLHISSFIWIIIFLFEETTQTDASWGSWKFSLFRLGIIVNFWFHLHIIWGRKKKLMSELISFCTSSPSCFIANFFFCCGFLSCMRCDVCVWGKKKVNRENFAETTTLFFYYFISNHKNMKLRM